MKILVFIESSEEGLKQSDLELLGFFEEKGLPVSALAIGEKPKHFSKENIPKNLSHGFFHKDLNFYQPQGLAELLKSFFKRTSSKPSLCHGFS